MFGSSVKLVLAGCWLSNIFAYPDIWNGSWKTNNLRNISLLDNTCFGTDEVCTLSSYRLKRLTFSIKSPQIYLFYVMLPVLTHTVWQNIYKKNILCVFEIKALYHCHIYIV